MPSNEQPKAMVGEEDILTALRWHLRRGRALVRVGDTVLAPRSYAVYLGVEDYQHWVDTTHRRDQLSSYLRQQLAHELAMRGWESNGPISVSDIHISFMLDAQLADASTDVRSSVDRTPVFSDLSPITERMNRAAQRRTGGDNWGDVST